MFGCVRLFVSMSICVWLVCSSVHLCLACLLICAFVSGLIAHLRFDCSSECILIIIHAAVDLKASIQVKP